MFSFICEYKNGNFIPMIIFARKIQIIFVNHKKLILMGSKDSKLMKTWAWDRSLLRNCRGFCLGEHREIINFTVSLPARTKWWFKERKKEKKKTPYKIKLLDQNVLAVFPWLSCFQENTVFLLLALSFRTFLVAVSFSCLSVAWC